jgi:hypothetical protein
MSSWQIYAVGDHYHAVDDVLPELKALTQASTGKVFRRIGRFIQLALIGSSRCAGQHKLPQDTAVYFASGRGDLELTLEIMARLYVDAQAPKPLSFVNTVSNAACFYLAKNLDLQARSNFVCNRYFAFESVLQLAALDLTLGRADSALVGSVDIATAPLPEHRRRLGVPANTPIGEASHWLWLGPITGTRPRLGELSAARHFVDRNELLSWMSQQQWSSGQCLLSAGQFLPDDDFAFIQKASGLSQVFEYRHERAWYDSQSGAVVSAFLNAATREQTLLHINSDGGQRYSVMLLRLP